MSASPTPAAGGRATAGRAPQPVLLYDGECGLCNAVVRFLIRRDRSARLRFAPLQSAPAQAYLRAQQLPTADFDSLVFVPDWAAPVAGAYQLRTDGALGALGTIGGAWRRATLLRILPRAFRDAVYRLIARTRYAVFGRHCAERGPTPAADRFLPGALPPA